MKKYFYKTDAKKDNFLVGYLTVNGEFVKGQEYTNLECGVELWAERDLITDSFNYDYWCHIVAARALKELLKEPHAFLKAERALFADKASTP